jgi:hypothetical protein
MYPGAPIVPGAQFSELTVIREIDRVGTNRRALCVCSCGKEKIAYFNNLRAGRATSCGCTYHKGAAARQEILRVRRLRSQESDEGRICLTCNEWKPWSQFGPNPKRTRGKESNCLDCGRWNNIKRTYGISKAQWEGLFQSQNGCCALCDTPQNGKNLAVDHDHSCCGGKKGCALCIRGLLCDTCNRMLGLVEQNPRLRELFSFYLNQRPLTSRD